MPFEPPVTVADVLRRIQTGDVVLPAIQREFVWDPDDRITKLFDSLLRGYPIGTFLSWQVQPEVASKFKFYGFVREYHEKNAPHCPVLDLAIDGPVTAVLDGQQRLTSLNVGLRGSHAKRKKGAWWKHESSFPVRHLYLNLLADAPDEHELGLLHDFRFFESPPEPRFGDDVEDPCYWYPVNRIYAEQSLAGPFKELMGAGLGSGQEGAVERLELLHQRVHNEPLITFFREDDQSIDRVLDIFIRVNSQGKPLSHSDLLLSIATAQFTERDARAAVHSLVDELNRIEPGFDFDKDTVLKAGLALVGAGDFSFKVKNFSKENTVLLDKRWDEIADTLRVAVGLLADFGHSAATLTARSVVIPIANYLDHRGLGESYRTSPSHQTDRAELRHWVNRTLIKSGIWGSGLDTLLRDLRSTIAERGDTAFPTEAISDAMSKRGKSISFTPEEVVDMMDTKYTQGGCFALLATMFPHVDTRNVFHIDHVYPQKSFSKTALVAAGVADDDIESFKDRRHQLPNLQLLEGPTNSSKQAMDPTAWAKEHFLDEAALGQYLERNDLGEMPDSIAGFDVFFEGRRRRLAARLAEVLGVDPAGVVKLLDEQS